MDQEQHVGSGEDSGSDFELDADDKPERPKRHRLPALAQLDEPNTKSRKGRSSFSDPPASVPNKAARDARRRTTINALALAAARFNDDDLNETLRRAQNVKRLEQSELFAFHLAPTSR